MRFKAEWEKQEAVLLAMPNEHTDWCYMIEEAINQYVRLVNAIAKEEINVILLCRDAEETINRFEPQLRSKILPVETEYNDTWTRDYGPLTIEKDDSVRTLDFGFNGWGLKFASDKDNLVNLRLAKSGILNSELYRNNRDFELEGGSVDTDGEGTILTTTRCLCSPNRNGGKSKNEISEILQRRLGATHILWLDYGALQGDDTDSHIDTLARMAPGNSIIYTGCRDIDDPHFEELLHMKAQLMMFRNIIGEPYNLIELPLPEPVLDPDSGERLPATYANYLVTENVIFMPSYAQPKNDKLASDMLRIAFPQHKIITVDCRSLLRQHGSLHCATMQLYPTQLKNHIF